MLSSAGARRGHDPALQMDRSSITPLNYNLYRGSVSSAVLVFFPETRYNDSIYTHGVVPMAKTKQEWEALGRNIEDIVDRAVTSHDFQKLNQTIRQAVDLGTDAVRKAVDTAQKKAAPRPGEAKKAEVLTAKQVEALYGNTNGKTAKGILKIVGGGLLTGVALALLITSLVFDILATGAISLTAPIVLTLAGFGSGGALIGSGVGNLNRIGRFKKYKKILFPFLCT